MNSIPQIYSSKTTELSSLHLYSPAKINIFLKVVGKRFDGFHDLHSLFCFIDLFDELKINFQEKFSIKISGEFDVDIDNNIFTRIISYIKDDKKLYHEKIEKINIELKKNIPVGSGLGGASSNAAVFLMWLNRNLKWDLDKNSLQDLGAKFGSDIPFFFEKSSSIIQGRGEIIKDRNITDFHKYYGILIFPNILISTKEVFLNFDIDEIDNKEVDIKNIKNLENDLIKTATKLYPDLNLIIKTLDEFNIFFNMSGSGSSFFILCENEREQEKCFFIIKENLKEKFSNLFIKKFRIIDNPIVYNSNNL